jgi:hypothetical protein
MPFSYLAVAPVLLNLLHTSAIIMPNLYVFLRLVLTCFGIKQTQIYAVSLRYDAGHFFYLPPSSFSTLAPIGASWQENMHRLGQKDCFSVCAKFLGMA